MTKNSIEYTPRWASLHLRELGWFLAILVLTLTLILQFNSVAHSRINQHPPLLECSSEQIVSLGNQPLFCLQDNQERVQELSQQIEALASVRDLQLELLQANLTTEGDKINVVITYPKMTTTDGALPEVLALDNSIIQQLKRTMGWQALGNELLAQKFLDLLKDGIRNYLFGQCQISNQIVRLNGNSLFCIRTWIQAEESPSERVERVTSQIERISNGEIGLETLGIVEAAKLESLVGIHGFIDLPGNSGEDVSNLPMAIVSDQVSLSGRDKLIIVISQLDAELEPKTDTSVELANRYLEIINNEVTYSLNPKQTSHCVQFDWGPYQAQPYLWFSQLTQMRKSFPLSEDGEEDLQCQAFTESALAKNRKSSQHKSLLFPITGNINTFYNSAYRAVEISKRINDLANDREVLPTDRLEVVYRKDRENKIFCDYEVIDIESGSSNPSKLSELSLSLTGCGDKRKFRKTDQEENSEDILADTIQESQFDILGIQEVTQFAVISPKRRGLAKESLILTIANSDISTRSTETIDTLDSENVRNLVDFAKNQAEVIQAVVERYKEIYIWIQTKGSLILISFIGICIAACSQACRHSSFPKKIIPWMRLIFIILIFSTVIIYLYMLPPFFRWMNQLSDAFWLNFQTVWTNIYMYMKRDVLELIIIALFVVLIIVCIKLSIDVALPRLFPILMQKELNWTPTQRKTTFYVLVFLIVAISFVIVSPHLPGAGTPYLAGVSAFIALAFSISASASIADVIAGLILIYLTSLNEGDWVKIENIAGQITEQNLLVHRIRTYKNTVVTVPNAKILNSLITNFSASTKASAATRGEDKDLTLYTTVTLGYDIPWRKVERVLLQAAQKTAGLLSTPAPFVLQTSLDDFYVRYELNAHTNQPDKIPVICSELHQNIQDECMAAKIEILSPHYEVARDDNSVTIPQENLEMVVPGWRTEDISTS